MSGGEVWREVPSLPNILVSSEGRIMVKPYRAAMPNGHGHRPYGGKPHFGVWNKQDERFIIVYKGHTYKVARLVCEAFHGAPPDDQPVCMHLDENAANNRADNLAWGSQRENLMAPKVSEYRRRSAVMKINGRKPPPSLERDLQREFHDMAHEGAPHD